MDAKLQALCDRVPGDVVALRKKMFWELCPNDLAILGAYLAAMKGQPADPERFKACKKMIRRHCGIFSAFRGSAEAMVALKMSLQPDPEQFLLGSLDVYKRLRVKHKWTASAYMVMAAMNIYSAGGTARADGMIEQLDSFYYALRKAHPLLISDEDRGYLSMLVAAGLPLGIMEERIEAAYQACKKVAFSKNSVNSMAQILALSGKSADEKAAEVRQILDIFKREKHKIDKSYGLAAVGALVLLNGTPEEKAAKVIEVADTLKGRPGFKWYHMTRRTRMIFACLLVVIADGIELDDQLANSISETLAMTLIEQIIILMVIIIMSSTVSYSKSSNNG